MRAEEALRERESALSRCIRAAPVGIGQVSDRVSLPANDRLSEMVGSTKAELIWQKARFLCPNDEGFERVGRDRYAQILGAGWGTVETRW